MKLPSGAVLKIGAIPFKASNTLKKEVMKQVMAIDMKGKDKLGIGKDVLCSVLSSDEVEKALWECMGRCIYSDGRGDLKIDEGTFEPVESRVDFTECQMEVAQECLLPFGKSLYAVLEQISSLALANTPQ